METIVVEVLGGLVQSVTATGPVQVYCIDHDRDLGGQPAAALVFPVVTSAERVGKLVQSRTRPAILSRSE